MILFVYLLNAYILSVCLTAAGNVNKLPETCCVTLFVIIMGLGHFVIEIYYYYFCRFAEFNFQGIVSDS